MKDSENSMVVTLPDGNNIVVPEDAHGELYVVKLPQ